VPCPLTIKMACVSQCGSLSVWISVLFGDE
jgi:hypothetical protein